MRYILLIILSVLLSFSASAQDLRYQDVLSAFSHKDLPKSNAINSYQAIDGQIYTIGDWLEIGYPKEQNSKRFSYIYSITTEHSGVSVSIVKFEVLKKKDKDMGTIGATVGAIVSCEGKIFFVNNFDLAIEYSEIIKGTGRNNVNIQSVPEKNANCQNVGQPVSQAAPNQSEVVANQQLNNQSGMVTFGAETNTNSSNNQTGMVSFGAETGANNLNNYFGPDPLSDVPERKGYGGIVIADIGFDALNIGMSLGVSVINGYHFNSNWYVGGGVGVLCYVGGAGYSYYESYSSYGYGYSYYYYEDVNSVCVPIFAYGKYTFTIPKKVWPYVALGLGVNISSDSSVYMNVSGGIAIRMKKEKQHLKVGLSFPMDFANGIGMGVQVGYSF